MEIGYSILFAAIAAAAGASIGAMLIGMFEHGGRAVLTRQCAIAVIGALTVFVVPGLVSGFEVYSDLQQWAHGVDLTAVFSLGLVGSAIYSAKQAPSRVHKYMDLVSRVVPFALKNFDDIDYDDDQIISMKDLDRAMMQKPFAGAETQEILQFMRRHIHDIGHDVGSYNAGGSTGTTATVSVINRADIERFAAKTAKKYAAWQH